MKSGDKLRMMALRGVLSEISRLEKDVRRDPNDAEILQIIKRERAKREESLEFARKAARQDLIEQNEAEAKIRAAVPAARVIYIEPDRDDFLTQLNLVDEPLASLPLERVRPGPEALEEIMEGLR